ncbi:MAG: beta-lactamase family protein [Ardenticatenaceae bacterium]|nr:beta-lactamase family protein [Ardenticatenaceae bacterium]
MMHPEDVGMSSERLARVRPTLEKYIADDKVAGIVATIVRRGQVVYEDCLGLMDRETQTPMRPDAIFRIYSMTKPIICLALMTLYEQGLFHLNLPVAAFIPAFNSLKVYAGEDEAGEMILEELRRPVTIRDLLTHTSGLTYHWLENGRVEQLYRDAQLSFESPLDEFVAELVKLPLAFQPGTSWRYSLAHDVVAYLVQLISGKPVDVYLRETIFEPLGMVDTGYYVPEAKLDRLVTMYGSVNVLYSDVSITRWFGDAMKGASNYLAGARDSLESAPHQAFRGGHGLVSTAADYLRFAQMLLNGGELNGRRIISRKTLELMTANHLAPNLLPVELGGVPRPGEGYGLGFGVIMDIGQYQAVGSVGSFSWGGAASTTFWVDPQEELIGVMMSQYQPPVHLLTPDFKVMAYQAIAD